MKMNFARTTAQIARRFRDREALVHTERKRRYTFEELDRLTNRIVNMMRDRLELRRGDTYLCILQNDNLSLSLTQAHSSKLITQTRLAAGRQGHS